MTYGWMLLVVAVVGGAVFSVAGGQNMESVSGFVGEDVLIDDLGVNNFGELQLVLRNGGAEKIELNQIVVSRDGEETVWKPSEEYAELEVADTQVATFLQVEEGDSADTLDVELNYDQAGLENLTSSGTVSGSFDILENSVMYDMDPFVLQVNSSENGDSADDEFLITTGTGNFNYQVEWESLDGEGEGEITDPITGDRLLNFDEPGIHQIEIRGLFPHYSNFNTQDSDKLHSLEAWGDIEWTSMHRSFQLASNLEAGYSDKPDLSRVDNMHSMFRSNGDFNGEVSGWDTSNVENMKGIFRHANSFDGDVSEWDTENVQTMDATFQGVSGFNSDVSGWDTSSVENMNWMFRGASSFNRDISSWNVSNVQTMERMFQGASSFDQDISSWCVEDIGSKPNGFDSGAGFEGDDSKQPNWGEPC